MLNASGTNHIIHFQETASYEPGPSQFISRQSCPHPLIDRPRELAYCTRHFTLLVFWSGSRSIDPNLPCAWGMWNTRPLRWGGGQVVAPVDRPIGSVRPWVLWIPGLWPEPKVECRRQNPTKGLCDLYFRFSRPREEERRTSFLVIHKSSFQSLIPTQR